MNLNGRIVTVLCAAMLCSCAKKESADAGKQATQAPAAAEPAHSTQAPGGPHAVVYLKDGSKVPGTIVASSQNDVVVAGDDAIERKIPLGQVKSIEYGEAPKTAGREAPERRKQPRTENVPPAQVPQQPASSPAQQAATPPPPPLPPPPPVTTRTYELAEGSEVSVRTNEPIDSATANEGQTFDAVVTRDTRDADGAVVIPRGSEARVVIKSASRGGKFHSASDLVLDLQSVAIDGRTYSIDTADMSEKGKAGVGANSRTAKFAGGGAALGAIIGAIAGGGKGAAIGAGAGAGAGAVTQVLTKGAAIRVPAETVLTFQLDKPLRVTAKE